MPATPTAGIAATPYATMDSTDTITAAAAPAERAASWAGASADTVRGPRPLTDTTGLVQDKPRLFSAFPLNIRYHSGAEVEPDAEANSSSSSDDRVQKSSWQHSCAILVGETLGTGVMGLPLACANLGWVLGLLCLVLFGLAAVGTGVALGRVRNRYYPNANSYADLAREIVGPRAGTFVQYSIWFYWFLVLPYYLMAAASSMAAAEFDYDL